MPKQYDRNDLLDRAVEIFRRTGYKGTSTATLVEGLGVNRKTMYAEFGSKQGLFEAALERYEDCHLTRVLSLLEAPDARLDAISRAFAGFAAAAEGRFRGQGCLLCNTAVERTSPDPASGRHVDAYLARITAAFGNALGNARREGEIDATSDLDEIAAFLTTAMIGEATCVRAEAPPAQLQATSRVVDRVLDGLRVR